MLLYTKLHRVTCLAFVSYLYELEKTIKSSNYANNWVNNDKKFLRHIL